MVPRKYALFCIGPPRKICIVFTFFAFFRPSQKMFGMAPNGAGKFFFWLIQTLPTFWAEPILILRIFIFFDFWGPKFLARAQLGPGLGPVWAHTLGPSLGPHTWAQLGLIHLGPAWEHPLGPGLGPPTWAQLGPTHLGRARLEPSGPKKVNFLS